MTKHLRQLRFLKNLSLFLILIFLAFVICSCRLVQEVAQSTHTITDNRLAVEASTHTIEANKLAIEESNEAIRANKELIEMSNKAILGNEEAIEKASRAIEENEKIISHSTEAIRANIAAVELSSAMITKNAAQIKKLSELLDKIKLDPVILAILMLILAVNLFLIPMMMIFFMWRIHRDMVALRKKMTPR